MCFINRKYYKPATSIGHVSPWARPPCNCQSQRATLGWPATAPSRNRAQSPLRPTCASNSWPTHIILYSFLSPMDIAHTDTRAAGVCTLCQDPKDSNNRPPQKMKSANNATTCNTNVRLRACMLACTAAVTKQHHLPWLLSTNTAAQKVRIQELPLQRARPTALPANPDVTPHHTKHNTTRSTLQRSSTAYKPLHRLTHRVNCRTDKKFSKISGRA